MTYDPEVITGNVSARFTRTTNGSGVNVYGKIVKGDTEVGTVSVDGKSNFMIVSVKPMDGLDAAERKAVFAKAAVCVEEILND